MATNENDGDGLGFSKWYKKTKMDAAMAKYREWYYHSNTIESRRKLSAKNNVTIAIWYQPLYDDAYTEPALRLAGRQVINLAKFQRHQKLTSLLGHNQYFRYLLKAKDRSMVDQRY